MRIDALLAQHGHARARAVDKGGSDILARVERELHVQTRVADQTTAGVLGVGAIGVVALLADLPAHAVPYLVQVVQAGREDLPRIAPDAELVFADVDGRVLGPGTSHHMREARQAVRAQGLHHRITAGGRHLQQHAQLFVEQRLERQLVAAHAHLLRPVLGVARFHAAVAHAVAFGQQHVDVERHAHLPGNRHFKGGGKQAAIAAVVVGENFSFGAQGIHCSDEVFQVLGIVQVGHRAAALAQGLREDAAAHARLALAQVDEDQRALHAPRKLRRERAAHVRQGGKGGDDQADRRDHFFGFATVAALVLPLRAHRQAVLAHRNGNAQRGAQLHTDGAHRVVQRGVFARFAARRHPVG